MENNTNVCLISPCVGYAFVPYQMLDRTYAPAKALSEGTVFPELRLTMEEYGRVCKDEGVH